MESIPSVATVRVHYLQTPRLAPANFAALVFAVTFTIRVRNLYRQRRLLAKAAKRVPRPDYAGRVSKRGFAESAFLDLGEER